MYGCMLDLQRIQSFASQSEPTCAPDPQDVLYNPKPVAQVSLQPPFHGNEFKIGKRI